MEFSLIGRRKQICLRIGGIAMQVTKLTVEQIGAAPEKHQYTIEEMQRKYNYVRADSNGCGSEL